MSARQRIVRERRLYNKWVASQTLEDFALRYTATRARRWSAFRIASTAIGATSFLACEAIGGSITLAYGFPNAVAAIAASIALMFLIGLPIALYAADNGLDIDLLTRGAGFGYLGSTITSLIYASFTFLLFAIEASIMSAALEMALGIPLALAHVISSLVVIPIALYGMSLITKMQAVTQPIWILLQLAPVVYILIYGRDELKDWTHFAGRAGAPDGSFNLLLFGMALSTLLSLLPQIGEQSDYLRFMPQRGRKDTKWWAAVLTSGPGWVFVGGFKLLIGSFLALFAIWHGVGADRAANPTDMFRVVFREMSGSPTMALVLTGVFVVVCQLKINVTNAYAGSIAWSNFFSRLTHAHPGRVVWLLFNVLLALLLMEIGVFRVIEGILILYANLAAGWIGALSADLIVSKPLGLSPKHIEFKRAHLYDINPVGVGAMVLSIVVSTASLVGLMGPLMHAFSPLLGLTVAFVAAPAIALATRGRYYLARPATGLPEGVAELRCVICENLFERVDMAHCPAYGGSICSLCCTLEARCHDLCKKDSNVGQQVTALLERILPTRIARSVRTTTGQFVGVVLLFNLVIGGILYGVYVQYGLVAPEAREVIQTTLWSVFLSLLIVSGIAAWLMVLAHASRRAAEQESALQTTMLMDEISAHERTDAELQKAKEVAESANAAKSRYLVGVSHEIRSPLNAIYGYAQLLEREADIAPAEAGRVIRRSSEHLTTLVEGLLDISRIESGVLRLSRDKVAFPEFLNQIADMFRMQAEAKGVAFKFERPARLPAYVRTDQKRLRQILINLLSNAVKYTADGEVRLSLRYRGQVAEFEVADTGIGILPQDLEAIFEPFERGGMQAAQSMPGVGLGLAITKVLTHVLGGEIAVTSEPGKGSCFVVRLMLSEPLDTPTETFTRRQIRGYAGPRKTLLLVDDDPVHLSVTQNLMKPLGFVVYAASDGMAGLELAARCKPDLVMLDIQMPGMTGWQVAARLRQTADVQPRIMMVSANAHEHTPGGDERSVHDAFVMKPVELEVLLGRVGELLDLTWLHDEDDVAAEPVARAGEPAPGSSIDLGELYRLGRIGHVRAIEAKLDEMEARDPANGPFVARLRALVKRFDLKSYLAILQGVQTHD
jgi:signal transduction histidine kinase/DNA-binding LytR/AlgR family response regulator